jgi:hypothetical protein
MTLLAAIPVGMLLWLIWKRPRLRVAGNQEAVLSGAARRLIEAPGLRVDGIYLTEVIELGHDLLVGYRRGPEVPPLDQSPSDPAMEVRAADHEEGQMLLPGIVLDEHGMLFVQRWCADHTALASLTSLDRKLFGLVDRPGGMAIVVELIAPS